MSQAGLAVRFVDTLTALFCREGSGRPPATYRPRIEWEVESGQWVMLRGEDGGLLGWQSWYRVDELVADLVRREGLGGLIAHDVIVDLTTGDHCLVATTVCVPWASRLAPLQLTRLTRARNLDAVCVCSLIEHPNGRRHWATRYNPKIHTVKE